MSHTWRWNVKRKLLNVMIYGAMVLTACAVNRGVLKNTAGKHVAATSAAVQKDAEHGTDWIGTEEAVGSGQAEAMEEPGKTEPGMEDSGMIGTGTAESAERIYDMEGAVANAILHKKSDAYMLGECQAEGHYILDTEADGEQITAYVLAMFGYYGFEDGNFVKVSGSGAVPSVITFKKHPDGSFGLLDYREVMDGGMYLDSVKELFPERLWEQCLHVPEDIMENLRAQERQYATEYLKVIGRAVEIGEYSDYDHKILTDLGVSVEVSNMMSENKELEAYPFWLGNRELVEDGVRYVYEMAYRMDKEEIRYTKYVYDSEEIVEQYIFDAMTGSRKTD